WREISGHTLLERYGMTEFGMALSNPLHGERRPGFVGTPLPGVEVRLVDEGGTPVGPGTAGELEVRGCTVFCEYWRRPEATAAACAVVGVEDAEWGERVCAAVELAPGGRLTLPDLRAWAKQRLAPYKVPQALSAVPALPRNALGKVVKPEVAKLFRAPPVIRG